MFDIGWSELLIIAVGVVLLLGPKELPGVMRQIAIFFRRLGSVKTAVLEQVHGLIEDEDGHGKVSFLSSSSASDSQTAVVKTQNREQVETDNVTPLPQSKSSDELKEKKQA